jgi:4-nitrophenyl phosphatase
MMRRYPLYIFDLDGTLYRGAEALPGASETLKALRRDGALVRFLTNNSSQTPEAQAAKLQAMGIPADAEHILTAGVGAANYLRDLGLLTVFVVGEPGLIEVLERAGIRMVHEKEASDAVVVGICRTFHYAMLHEAMYRIHYGARFIATNTDATYPIEGGRLIPGAGSIVAAVRTCAGIDPLVIGKPNTLLVEMILKETGCAPSDALVVGDRYETDIVSGLSAGCDTLLVLTGVTHEPPPNQAFAASLLELLG